jgi:hypothetical protein
MDDVVLLEHIHEAAIEMATRSLLTDACLIYQPSQIAMTHFVRAAQKQGHDVGERCAGSSVSDDGLLLTEVVQLYQKAFC